MQHGAAGASCLAAKSSLLRMLDDQEIPLIRRGFRKEPRPLDGVRVVRDGVDPATSGFSDP
jgi:hypothetical protein